LVNEVSLYYDAGSKKHQNPTIVNIMFDETGRHVTRMGDKRGFWWGSL